MPLYESFTGQYYTSVTVDAYGPLVSFLQTTLKSLDPMHDYAARVMGAGFLALGVTSGRANNCHTEDDKKSVLLSHGLVSLIHFYLVHK